MAKVMDASEAAASSSDHGVGTTADVEKGSFLSRLKGQRIDLDELGKQYYQQSLQYDEEQLKRDAIKVRRKLDFLVLPLMATTYMLSFLDKQTLNYSNAYGLQEDTHMKGNDYAWVSSALYFGWLTGSYPWQLLLQRFPIGRLIGVMLFFWGATCMLQATVYNFSGFVAIRFFLGMFEAVVSPAFVLLTSMLWTREEQSLRTSYWLSVDGMASIIGALLAYGVGHVHHVAVAPWRLIYLIVGAMTFAWGFVIFLYLPDGPHNVKALSEYERVVAVWRISQNQTGLKHNKIVPGQIKEALLDPKSWLLFLIAVCVGMLNGGTTNFLSAIIAGFGYSPLKTSLLQTPVGAFELVLCIVFGYLSELPNFFGITIMRKCFALFCVLFLKQSADVSVSCLPGLVGLIGILTIPFSHRFALVIMCWFQGVIGSPLVLNWTVPGLNTAGHTKRTTVLGVYFIFFCSGNIIGPHLFLASEKPRYQTAIKSLVGAYAAVIGLQAIYTTYCWMENRAKARAGLLDGVSKSEVALEGFDDLTDKQNKHFRYRI
ncbi:hypothetical protein SEPCBS119000_004777 [Sporothrix epigloea]|uniref:Major facilitator superfamily (MFS) profile domain-containing protein n=1 Tax=Sporothrix epigloea TaxID=1892477 RepID=A0ABP0DU96_9PEZI